MSGTLGKDGAQGKRPPRRAPRARRTGMAGGMAGGRDLASARPKGQGAAQTSGAAAPDPDCTRPAAKRRRAAPEAPPPKPKAVGFLHAASLAAPRLQEASARRGFAEPRILTDWPVIAGETLAAHCRPLRVSYAAAGFGATLTVQADGARATEVEMMGPRIVERVNAHYGYRAISRVRVVQSGKGARGFSPAPAAAGFAEPAAPFARRGPAPETPMPEVEDDRLRAALQRLGARIRARAQGS